MNIFDVKSAFLLQLVMFICMTDMDSMNGGFGFVRAQDNGVGFEFPVQLIGFPVIIMAVRTSNFVKKLAYAVNPKTYRRATRSIHGISKNKNETNATTTTTEVSTSSQQKLDFSKVDKELVSHLGPDFCIYEQTCASYVDSAQKGGNIDWTDIINNFGELSVQKQQFYLLSIFLGNIIQSKELCHHFKTMGKVCPSAPEHE